MVYICIELHMLNGKKKIGKGEYINIKKISITPGLCNYALPKRQYGCTQPTKKKEKYKEKFRYRVTILVAATQPPPSQHLMSNSSKSPPSRRNQCQAQPIK